MAALKRAKRKSHKKRRQAPSNKRRTRLQAQPQQSRMPRSLNVCIHLATRTSSRQHTLASLGSSGDKLELGASNVHFLKRLPRRAYPR